MSNKMPLSEIRVIKEPKNAMLSKERMRAGRAVEFRANKRYGIFRLCVRVMFAIYFKSS